MAGVDSITKEILQEARDKADSILAETNNAIDAMKKAAKAESQKSADKLAEKADADAKAYASRIESQIGLRRRQALLEARQEIISDVIEKAYRKLDAQDDASYFEMIIKLVKANVRPADGEIMMTEKDLKRLPANFETKIKEIAEDQKGKLTLSKEAADIENGFILRYGGIDENCSLRAIFDDRMNDLQDAVHHTLW
ncbi:MAG: V-type ATP synthase subunit E [Eubacterium sp.]|jgi:V/A-type H+-transporting ATPase subunit E|uniref:Archaeal/vacuolar-type H+-ATPase subunit E n=1 Tax=Eubacterium cellulosolvens (strain ATCC 43171 / JCM 9499 / 6) TaxID=633697 RepID=I5AVR3_EUBC6|nr:V-type ATP synthase subunit E [Eubacterium sp.]